MGLIEVVLASLCLNATCDYNTDYEEVQTPITLLNSSSNSIRLQHLRDLGSQLSKDTLKITTFKNGELSGWKMQNGTVSGTGVAFEIVQILQEKYKFNYTIVVPPTEVFLGFDDQSGAKNLLEGKQADFAAAFLPVINAFRNTITYSTSFDTPEWVVLMNRPKESATGSGLLAPFTTPVWILIICSILIVGPIIYLLVLIQARLCRDDHNTVYPLPSCVWFVYGALLKQGCTINPKTDSSRLLFSTWWIFILILTAFYTANLTAFLTLSTFTLPIDSAEDIGKKNYKWVTNRANGLREVIYSESQQVMYQKRLVDLIGDDNNYPDLEDMEILNQYVTQQKMMFIREKSVIHHIMYKDYKEKTQAGIDESQRCTFVVTKFPVAIENGAFAYAKKFKYKELFDVEIQRLVESGIIQFKLKENLPDVEICPLNLKSTERKLRNADLRLTYIIVASGLGIAACVFLMEILWRISKKKYKMQQRTQRANQIHISNGKFSGTLKDKNTFNGNGLTISPPPPYQTLFNPPLSFDNTEGVKKNINGRDYWIVKKGNGLNQLIPLRTPSALLFRYSD